MAARKKKADPNKPAYQKVYETFYDETRRWSTEEREMAVFLLTGPQRVTEGLYCLFPEDAAAKLGREWPVDRVERAMSALEARGWLLRDQDAGWVMLVNALRWDQPGGAPQVTGAVRRVNTAPRDSLLWDAFLAAARLWANELYAELTGTPKDDAKGPDIDEQADREAGFKAAIEAARGLSTDTLDTAVSDTPETPSSPQAHARISEPEHAHEPQPALEAEFVGEFEPQAEPEFGPEPGAEAEFERLRLLDAQASIGDLRVIGGGESLGSSTTEPSGSDQLRGADASATSQNGGAA